MNNSVDYSQQIYEEIKLLRQDIKDGMLRQQATDVRLTELSANFNNLLSQINTIKKWLMIVSTGIVIAISESLMFYVIVDRF